MLLKEEINEIYLDRIDREYTIPSGYEAEIKDGKVIVRKKKEPLTEFEEAVKQLTTTPVFQTIECIKLKARELLELARKQHEFECYNTYKRAYMAGREDEAKDLPRWKKAKEHIELGENDFVFTLEPDGNISPYWDTEVEKGQYYITEQDILRLPKEV